MDNIKIFTFNPFQENTYVIHDVSGECVIIDPGCYLREEKEELKDYIEQNGLKPVKLLLTHGHIDHILGNFFVYQTWGLKPEMHKEDIPLLHSVGNYAHLFGVDGVELSPEPELILNEGDGVLFGNTELEVLFVPGHAPGHIAFFNRKEKYVIGGDVLFRGSIGRTDLPGGDFNTLISSIEKKFYPLGDDVVVFSGHGPYTTIGDEKKHNPFLTGQYKAYFN